MVSANYLRNKKYGIILQQGSLEMMLVEDGAGTKRACKAITNLTPRTKPP